VPPMKVSLVTFATEKFKASQAILESIASNAGWKYISYNPSMLLEIDPAFNSRPASSISRGFGLWSWKPTIILHELKKLEANEILFYIDAGDLFLPNIVDVYLHSLEGQDFLLFEGGGTIREYSKRSVLESFAFDGFIHRNKRMIEAGISFWKNRQSSVEVLSEWEFSCRNLSLLSDPSAEEPQFSNFIAHRHDQSLLSLIAIKSGAPIIRVSKRRSFQCNVMVQ
jgi:hypothetical protein